MQKIVVDGGKLEPFGKGEKILRLQLVQILAMNHHK